MINLTNDHLVTAGNTVTIGMLLLVAALFLDRVRRGLDLSRISAAVILMMGVVISNLGSVSYRSFWVSWRFFDTVGMQEIATYMAENSGYFTWTGVFLIWIGQACHIHSVFSERFGHWWLLPLLGIAVIFALIGIGLTEFSLSVSAAR